MPLLAEDAANLSNNELMAGVIETIITVDDMFQYIPFRKINSKAFVFNRETELATADFLSPNDPVNEGTTKTEEVTVVLRIIAGDVDVDKFLQSTQSDTNNQKAILVAAKIKGVSYIFKSALINGDKVANPKSFDGLAKLVPNSQTIVVAQNGGPLTLAHLDELKDLVLTTEDPFYIMRKATWRYIRELLRAAGGNHAIEYMMHNFGAGKTPMYDGVPVLRNEFISNQELCGTNPNTTSIYCVDFDETRGFCGVYGGSDTAGLVVEEIGTVQNKDADRTRIKWYVACALMSPLAVARLAGVTLD